MHIIIATDAWSPQVNGVVRSYQHLIDELINEHKITLITPNEFYTFPLPLYPEIRISVLTSRSIGKRIETLNPDAIHIATEGTIGLATRNYCIKTNRNFTTAYHTRFPEYLNELIHVPLSVGYAICKWFHSPATNMMVSTESLAKELEKKGFNNASIFPKGVNSELFKNYKTKPINYKRPIFLYVGRISKEKNIEAFLDLDLPGTKLVVGDGPIRKSLQNKFPDVKFLGYKFGADLALAYTNADVFVFPSLTDTFGIVMLEALACGTPIAAYPVRGPKEVIGDSEVGVLSRDLKQACLDAMNIKGDICKKHAKKFSWKKSAESFLKNLNI